MTPNELVRCTIDLEGIELEMILPKSIAIAYNNMRSDEIAGLLPCIFSHDSMAIVPREKIQRFRECAELMSLSPTPAVIRNLRPYPN